MRVLITGGAGFIGSNFIQHMVFQYPSITFINVDALTYAGNLNNLRSVENESNYHFYQGDITDILFLEEIFKCEKITHIVHFAAESHVDRSIKSADSFVKTNIIGTHYILELALKYNVKKHVQISTDEVYGDLSFDAQILFNEDSPLKPRNPYAASKASADLLALTYFKTHGFPVNIVRSSNNYGPRQFPEKLIPLTISKAMNNQIIPVYGTGDNIRDWLYVDDNCRAIEKILFSGKDGEIYNVGVNEERANIDLVKMILIKMGKPLNLIKYVDDRKGHDRRYALDATKIRSELDFIAKWDFDSALDETLTWYLQNEKWLLSISDGSYQS